MWPTDPPNRLQPPEPENPQDAPKHSQRDRQDYVRRTPRPSTVAASPPCSAPSNCNAACTNRSRTLATTTNHPLLLWNVIWGSSRAKPRPPWPIASVGWLPSRPNEMLEWLQREHHVRRSVRVLQRSLRRRSAAMSPLRSAGGAAADVARLVGAGAPVRVRGVVGSCWRSGAMASCCRYARNPTTRKAVLPP